MSVVDGLPFAEDKKDYILQTLDPILEEMVSDLDSIKNCKMVRSRPVFSDSNA